MNATEQGSERGERTLVVIPDANVLIHGKALVDLPWADLGRSIVEVLFVPPMIRELDKLKVQTGRQNKIARQLSSDIRTLIEVQDRRADVRTAAPAVSKRVELRALTEALHPALHLDHADQALINYALWLKQEGQDVLLITDDTICGTTAQEVGLPMKFLPKAWLRKPEPDESAKENARLKAEVQRLSAAEPKVKLDFHDAAGKTSTRLEVGLTRWPALSNTEIDQLMRDVQRLCPPAASFQQPHPEALDPLLRQLELVSRLRGFNARSVYVPATEEEIERYKINKYPEWLESIRSSLGTLHNILEARTDWPITLAVAENVGTRPAIAALLTIEALGAIKLQRVGNAADDAADDGQTGAKRAHLELSLPPEPPRGRTTTIDPLAQYRGLISGNDATMHKMPPHLPRFSSPQPRDTDAFYWRAGRRDWVGTMELECASWRHGQHSFNITLRVRPEAQVSTSAAIEISVQAHNITDPRVARLPVQFHYENGSTLDAARALVDDLTRTARARGRL